MRPPDATSAAPGFSVVELLVALVFTALLMAGLAAVFKSSLGDYVASAEATSGRRQNNLALDVLVDDLDLTGMTPSSLLAPPAATTTANPPFVITPNVAFGNTNVANPVSDQLFLYYDQVLPYPVTMGTRMTGTAEAVAAGATLATAMNGGNNITLNFNDPDQASLAATAFTQATVPGGPGMLVLLPSTGLTMTITSFTHTPSDPSVTITFSSTTTISNAAPAGSTIYLIVPGQYIRYSIQPRPLDPSNPTAYTPCLVRDQIAYPGAGAADWTSPISSTIVANDVTAFHVGLSANGGQAWAGMTGTAWNTTTASWPNLTNATADPNTVAFNTQLAGVNASVTAGTGLNSQTFWFRNFPTLVRVDLTTRSLNARTEFATAVNTAAYKYQTRSLIITPKHFGLFY